LNAAHAASVETVWNASHGAALIASLHARKSLTARSAHFVHVGSAVHVDWLDFDFTVDPSGQLFDLP
jgi:hypothetical protein